MIRMTFMDNANYPLRAENGPFKQDYAKYKHFLNQLHNQISRTTVFDDSVDADFVLFLMEAQFIMKKSEYASTICP